MFGTKALGIISELLLAKSKASLFATNLGEYIKLLISFNTMVFEGKLFSSIFTVFQ